MPYRPFACVLLAGLLVTEAHAAAPCRFTAEPAATAVFGGNRWVTVEATAPGLRRRIIDSAAVGAPASYHVLLPPGYANVPPRRFPVLYWLHGTGGGLLGLPTVAGRFDAAMRAGDMPPMIVVFPYGLASGMWVDSRGDNSRVESLLIDDLIPHVDACYRTFAAREDRILEGYSMGGYGVARLGLRHPELFAGVLMLAAGPLQRELHETPRATAAERAHLMQQVYGDDMGFFREQSPWVRAERAVSAGANRNFKPPVPRCRMCPGATVSAPPTL
ncbi:alpha/beta hydrolase-fold protein [Silanimonas sp.]|jgi:enterochelin esterase-like enzyme|uniref:alpha/beta hydrolase n=1 Tax=Silanimonas sp. TaxID=1929290 RepID=UPI0022CA9F4F|nr:alpha/beta hydrolase-fold protein [Silanimonas sp.]MCZ8116295.1 alpha/beta hydrolase-fold protein [Silanimonas sp.]